MASSAAAKRPNIIWVTVDDLGWCDYPWTGCGGSDVLSPTLSKLAAEGTVLDNYYVNPICTPTRASFMTGRYPIHLGLQHGVILDGVPEAVPLNETMVAEYLKDAGYRTFIVGKWHLGFYQKQYTPEARGFDAAYGYYTGNEEYWNHTSPCWGCGNYTALDLHRATATSFEPVENASMVYSTELFGAEIVDIIRAHPTSDNATGVPGDGQEPEEPPPLFLYAPFEAVHHASSCFTADKTKGPDCDHPDAGELQAPARFIAQQTHIQNPIRRTFAAMLGALDEAIKNMTEALQAKGMIDNTVLLVTTDNGAPFQSFDQLAVSNWPLRGGKGSLWEGGVRAAGFLWGVGVPRGVNNTKLFHAADWLPTFAALAGNAVPAAAAAFLDGHDIWPAIAQPNASVPSPRTEILHNIDPKKGEGAVRVGDFKLIVGAFAKGWGPKLSDPASPGQQLLISDVSSSRIRDEGPWLFDVRRDPSERINLFDDPNFKDTQKILQAAMDRYNASAVPCRLCNAAIDPRAAPPPVSGLNICTPSPVDPSDPTRGSRPILCGDVGVWQPWQGDDGSYLWEGSEATAVDGRL